MIGVQKIKASKMDKIQWRLHTGNFWILPMALSKRLEVMLLGDLGNVHSGMLTHEWIVMEVYEIWMEKSKEI